MSTPNSMRNKGKKCKHSWVQDASIKVCYCCGFKPSTPPAKGERWEQIYRIEMAKIIGSEGKFAMNSMVNLARSLRSQTYEEGRREAIEDVLRLRRFEDTDNGGMALDLSRKSPWINAEDIEELKGKEKV